VERSKGFWVRFLPILLVLTALFAEGAMQFDSSGNYVANQLFSVDLSAHLSIVTNFAYRVNAPAENPFFSGTPFNYSFLVDVYSAALLRAGMPLEIAFEMPAFSLVLSFFALCYFFFLRLYPNRNAAFLAITLLFFLSSVNVPQMLQDERRHPNAVDWFLNPDNDYSKLSSCWTNQFATSYLIPLRANALGYPLALIVFILLLEAIDLLKKRGKKECVNLFLFAGVLAGILPTIREFTFAVVCLVAFGLAVFYRDRRWLWFFAPMLLLALPQVIPLALYASGVKDGFAFAPGCFGWNPDCVQPQGIVDWVLYLFYSFNLPFFIAPMGFLLVSRKAQRVSLLLFLLFLAGVLFRFTPDAFNNMKLINFWQIGMCFLTGVALVRAWNTKEFFWRFLAALALFFTLFSGVISLNYYSHKNFVAYERGDVEFASFIRTHTGENAVFMTYGSSNALDLAGRQKVMGYPRTVWALGERDWSQRLSDQKDFYSGKRMREILAKYNVSYVVLTHAESYSDILFSLNYSAIKSAPFLRLVYLKEAPDANPNPKHYWMGRWALYKVVRPE
jgi:hypothetical protein